MKKKTFLLKIIMISFFYTPSLEAKEQFWILIRSAITPAYIANGNFKYGLMTSETTKDIFILKKNCMIELNKDFEYDKNQEGSKILEKKIKGPTPFYIIEFETVGMVVKAECDKVKIKD